MIPPPDDPPARPWRLSARLLAVDPAERILLVPVDDGEAFWWDLPGGGVEPGESPVAAAVRETAEETGHAVPVDLVGEPCWTGEVCFRWLGRWHWSRQVVHLARIGTVQALGALALTDEEQGTHGEARWIPLSDVLSGAVAVAPYDEPGVLRRLIAGERIDAASLLTWRPPPRPVLRPSGRVLLLDPDDRVLLMQLRAGDPQAGGVWFTPGGGLEAGEDARSAAARELAEETGQDVPPADLVGPVWTRRHVFAGLDLRETFFAARASDAAVDTSSWTPWEREQLAGHRWWSVAELDGAIHERFAPRRLATLLPEVLAAVPVGRPGQWARPPIDVGV